MNDNEIDEEHCQEKQNLPCNIRKNFSIRPRRSQRKRNSGFFRDAKWGNSQSEPRLQQNDGEASEGRVARHAGSRLPQKAWLVRKREKEKKSFRQSILSFLCFLFWLWLPFLCFMFWLLLFFFFFNFSSPFISSSSCSSSCSCSYSSCPFRRLACVQLQKFFDPEFPELSPTIGQSFSFDVQPFS